MPAPATVDEFLELVRKSTVVDENRLKTYLEQVRSAGTAPPEPNKFAGLMIRDGLLTYFQAEQFLQGRWKRFTIGRYKVLERLGSGGMGQVFLCEHKVMRRRVAVKVLPTAKAEDPSSLERFYREARAVAALDHPNIVRAYDIDQDDNLHFLVMEYVDGVSIQDVIKKFGPMDVLRTCHYMYQSAIGLQHAHESGLVHRDIKPGNVLVARDGTVKILDMGLARFFHDEEDMITKRYDESVLGTADYLAPEQAIDSHGVDIRADIYSLGATFYYMLTGAPPFAEGTVAQKLIWHQTRQPKPVTSVRPDVPQAVLAVLDRMMSKDVNQRFQTPTEVADALAPLVTKPIGAPPDREMPNLCLAALGRDLTSSPTSQSGTIRRPEPSSGPGTIRRAPVTAAELNITPPKPPPPGSSARQPTPTPTPTPTRAAASPSPVPNARAKSAATPSPAPHATPPSGISVPRAPVTYSTASVPDPYSPVWESLTTDTTNTAQADTDRRSGQRIPQVPATTVPFSESVTRPKWKILAVATALTLIVLAVVYFLFRGGDGTPVGDGNQAGRLYVGKVTEGEGRFPTIRAAIERAKAGDRIVVLEDITEDPLTLTSSLAKNLTIEAGNEAKRVTWSVKPPAKSTNYHESMLVVSAVEGLKLIGLTLEAGGHSNTVLRVAGRCPGLILEDVSASGARVEGVKFVDASGTVDRPIALDRVRVTPGKHADAGKDFAAAVIFKVPNRETGSSQNVQLRDCVLEGPAKRGGVVFDSSVNEVKMSRCRLASFPAGVLFMMPPPTAGHRFTLEQSTLFNMTDAAVKFDALVLPTSKSSYTVAGNLFVKCGATLVTADNTVPSGWVAAGNARDASTRDGPGLIAAVADVTALGTDASNPATFLRYPPTSPLATAGPNGGTVGYPE